MGLYAVSEPPHSVHGSPWASSEVHWLQASLAHDWRTIAMLLVLSGDNVGAPRAIARNRPLLFHSPRDIGH